MKERIAVFYPRRRRSPLRVLVPPGGPPHDTALPSPMKTGLVSLGLLLVLAGCGTPPTEPVASPSGGPSASPSESVSPSPSTGATSASPSKVPAPDPVSFSETVSYADGLKVEVVKTKHTKLSEEGGLDGNLAIGSPLLILSIRVTNGTGARLSLEDSDALLTYTGKKNEATNVDDVGTDTLYGHLAAGAVKTGKYGFAEPKNAPATAELEVTVDAHHPVARFRGALH
jgi:hypothetical protein